MATNNRSTSRGNYRTTAEQRPSTLLFWLESRAIYDAAGMLPMFALHKHLPKGDGHPVLVLPGFMAGARTTQPLRSLLRQMGYKAHCWKLGYNSGYSQRLHQGLRARVRQLADRYEQKVSLIGWSLGGVYAREIAREMPDCTRLVISMGSPFRAHPHSTNAHRVFDMVSSVRYRDMPAAMLESMSEPPPVPTSALYTRGDGVVAWQGTVEISDRWDVENIHVGGAHCGLGFNPRSVIAITDRLAQAENAWRPFLPAPLLRPLFHNWYPDWLVQGKYNPLRA
jgi:pimeloyl-ACP methyl ester carboxylesterase